MSADRPDLERLPAFRRSLGSTAPAPLFDLSPIIAAAPSSAPPPPTPPGLRHDSGTDSVRPVDWQLVYRLRARLAERLSNETGPEVAESDRVARGRRMIGDVIKEFSDEAIMSGRVGDQIARAELSAYIRAVDSATFGYGRWQVLMDDPDVENIEIRGHASVFMVYADRIETADPVADSDAELIEQLSYIATYSTTPKPFSPAHPEMTLNLEDRFRLHAVAFDVVDRPTIVIRQHKFTGLSLADLTRRGTLPPPLTDLLTAAVRAHKSIVVSGNQGVGKTTFVRALALAMDPSEAVGVIETDAELFLHKLPGRGRVINFTAREGTGEGTTADGRPIGEFSVQRHLTASLRQNLSRIIVGEVRDAEAAAMFQAMQSGAGSLSTIHAQHSRATIERLVTAAALGGVMSQADAYRQIAVNVHLIVHLAAVDRRPQGGSYERFVSEVVEVHGFAERGDGTAGFMPAVATIYEAADGLLNAELLSPQLSRDLAAAGWRA